MGEEDEILKKTLFPVSDLAPGTQLVDVATGTGQALSQVCADIKKILPTDHVRCWDARSMGLQDELRDVNSPVRVALSDGFYKLVIIDVSRGIDASGVFQYDELFLPYLRDTLFEAFGVEPTHNFHPEQISQVLKDEPRSLFCFFDAEHLSEAESLRLRGFTQEFHRVLMCAPKPRAETVVGDRRGGSLKVQLVIVQGKPEGKVIPIAGPKFRIGRGEHCHLRPNSDQVSREHAEFSLTADTVSIRDLGSRNGTLVNGKALREPARLKDRDLVQIGPLTFAVSVMKNPVSARPSEPSSARKALDDLNYNDIESWLVGDNNVEVHDRPSGNYEGDTITIVAVKDSTPAPEPKPSQTEVTDKKHERRPEGEGDAAEAPEIFVLEPLEAEGEGGVPEDFLDESNPFYIKPKAPEPATPAKPSFKETSDAASDILRKMMERRRGPR